MKPKNSHNRIINLSRFFVFKVIFFFLLSINLYAMTEIKEGDVRKLIPTVLEQGGDLKIIKEMAKVDDDGRAIVGSFCRKWVCYEKTAYSTRWSEKSIDQSQLATCLDTSNVLHGLYKKLLCKERVDVYIPNTKGVETAIENMDKSLQTAVTNALSKDPITTLTSKIEALEERIKELEKNKD